MHLVVQNKYFSFRYNFRQQESLKSSKLLVSDFVILFLDVIGMGFYVHYPMCLQSNLIIHLSPLHFLGFLGQRIVKRTMFWMSIGFLYWCTKMMLHPRHWRTRWGTSQSIPQCYVLRNLLRILGMVWDSNTHNSKEPKVDDHVIAMQFFTHIIIDDITKTQRCFVSDQIMDCTSLVWVLGIFNIFQWHMGE